MTPSEFMHVCCTGGVLDRGGQVENWTIGRGEQEAGLEPAFMMNPSLCLGQLRAGLAVVFSWWLTISCCCVRMIQLMGKEV